MLAARFCSRIQDMVRNGYSIAEITFKKAACIKRICRLLTTGAKIGQVDYLARFPFNNIKKMFRIYKCFCTLQVKTRDGPTGSGVSNIEISECFKELRKKIFLKHLCREAIRKHLIHLDPLGHRFENSSARASLSRHRVPVARLLSGLLKDKPIANDNRNSFLSTIYLHCDEIK